MKITLQRRQSYTLAVFVCALSCALLSILAPTQSIFAQSQPQQATGYITKPSAEKSIPIANAWVTLHRVGKDTSGPVDSVRTDSRGRYRLQFRPFGVSDAIYFTAVMYNGIAYFSAPIHTQNEDGDGDITVFDTTTGRVPIATRGHHIVIATPSKDGIRKVTEVFEVANDSFVTKVAAAGDSPEGASWSTPLVVGALRPTILEGDLPADATKFTAERLFVYAPFAPGLKQIAYTYFLKDDAFPLSIPVEGETSVIEVLVEEGNAAASGARLQQVAPVTIEGRQFMRYLGSEVPDKSVIGISIPKREAEINPWFVAALTLVIGGAMVGTLVWAMRRR